jgi:hypothetical protein
MKLIGLLILGVAGGLVYWGMTNLTRAFCLDDTGRVVLYGILFGLGIIIAILLAFSLLLGIESKVGCVMILLFSAAGVGVMFYLGWQRTELICPSGIYPALQGACRGQGNPLAGTTSHAQGGDYHVVVMSMAGKIHPDAGGAPESWRPASLEDTDYVLCLDGPEERYIETCNYVGGSDIERTRESMRAVLVSAVTGEKLGEKTFTCSPRSCGQTELSTVRSITCSVVVGEAFSWVEETLAELNSLDQGIFTNLPELPQPVEATATQELASEPTVPPTATPFSVATVKGNTARVRSAPDTNASILAGIRPGVQVKVLGANAARDWVKVALDDGTLGWVFVELVTLSVPIDSLPVVELP